MLLLGYRITQKLLWLGTGFLCAVVPAGCQDSLIGTRENVVCEKVIAWRDAKATWKIWGADGSSIFAVSMKPSAIDVWQWTDIELEKREPVPVDEGILSLAILSSNIVLYTTINDTGNVRKYFCLADLKSGKTIDHWPRPRELCIDLGRSSRNGKYAAAWNTPDGACGDSGATIGLIAPDGKKIEWITLLTSDGYSPPQAMIQELVPSDNGEYIGVAGWDNGLAMIDVKKKEVIWTACYLEKTKATEDSSKVSWKRWPLDEVGTMALAFSPDSKVVYSGGLKGCVYAMKTETGELISQWWTIPTNRDLRDGEISALSVSPDGRYLAAGGIGPGGPVYLFSTKTGKCRVLNHGGSTIFITSFSPDSKRLASFAAGKIKIWKLPEETEKPAAGTIELDKQTSAETQPSK